MAGYEGESERMWDEYDWERFLQKQDQKTEQYMQLLETHLDDPQRDEIIAREMGWMQLLDAKDWSAEVDALLDEDGDEEDDFTIEQAARSADTFGEHDLYRTDFALTISMDAAAQLRQPSELITAAQHAVLQQRLFQVRDGIIILMGEYRSEWRRRFGSEGFRS